MEHKVISNLIKMLEETADKWADKYGIDRAYYPLKIDVMELDEEFRVVLRKWTYNEKEEYPPPLDD